MSWQEKESTLRAEISSAHTEKRQMAQQLRDLQAKWTALQAKDPDVSLSFQLGSTGPEQEWEIS